MAIAFTTLQTNVGNNVQDVSATSKAIWATFLNKRYKEIWKRTLWSETIDDDYTFESVDTEATVALPTDFSRELFVADIANGHPLERMTPAQWWNVRNTAYSADSIDAGSPSRYVILRETISATGAIGGVIKLDPTPDTAETYAMPYQRKFLPMTGDSDTCTTNTALKIIASAATFITDGAEAGMRVKNTTDNTYGRIVSVDSETQLTMDWDMCPLGTEAVTVSGDSQIVDIDQALILGATADAWKYKRQMAKAEFYTMEYNAMVARIIAEQKAPTNQYSQMVPGRRDTAAIRPMTGWTPYAGL